MISNMSILKKLSFLIGVKMFIMAIFALCWDAKNLATECIHTWPADAL